MSKGLNKKTRKQKKKKENSKRDGKFSLMHKSDAFSFDVFSCDFVIFFYLTLLCNSSQEDK